MATVRDFKVGDKVYSLNWGDGVVTNINLGATYPVEVKWSDGNYDCFTAQGQFDCDKEDSESDIVHIDEVKKEQPFHELGEDEEEDNNKVEDAINPSHYKVEGLPEAIDIMNHLMTPEQFEGFLWGNIMKYAYRFGRKGDKGETAGKIAWYANQLKALEDWRKENET